MADVKDKQGTQIVFADFAGDFSPTAANDLRVGTPTQVQLAMASVANNAARQSAKVDLGATRAQFYAFLAALEFAASGLTAGNAVNFFWAPSPNATAGTANPAGVSGTDAAYAGYSSNLDDSVKQLDPIGPFVVTGQATATVQVAPVGVIPVKDRYGSLIVVNRSGAAIHSDDVEIHVVMTPIITDIT